MNKKVHLFKLPLIIGFLLAPGIVHCAGIDDTVVRFSSMSYEQSLQFSKNRQFKDLGTVVSCMQRASAEGPCAYVYSSPSRSEIIVELCQDVEGRKKGLYYIGAKGAVKRYAWFDAQFMEWACAEKVSTGNSSEYWGIRSGPGEFNALLFNFHINQNAGYYYFKLLPDEQTQVLDKQVEDLT
ncbi:MAG: hypothetical protein L0Z73_03245 [Gammaproteobacteria bacterium]|nr:hypothetical protein [Gammaproteobacteria bacterium]